MAYPEEKNPISGKAPEHQKAAIHDSLSTTLRTPIMGRLAVGQVIEGRDNRSWRKIGKIIKIDNGTVYFYNSSNPKGHEKYELPISSVEQWIAEGVYRIKPSTGDNQYKSRTRQATTLLFQEDKPREEKPEEMSDTMKKFIADLQSGAYNKK